MIARPEETSADSSELWFVDPGQFKSVALGDDGIISEANSAGQYADIPAEQVGPLLQELASKPWRQVIKQFYEKQNPWLYRIVTDPARVMAMELLDLRGKPVFGRGVGVGAVQHSDGAVGVQGCFARSNAGAACGASADRAAGGGGDSIGEGEYPEFPVSRRGV